MLRHGRACLGYCMQDLQLAIEQLQMAISADDPATQEVISKETPSLMDWMKATMSVFTLRRVTVQLPV